MKDSGSGYYQFDANTGPTGGKVVATGRTSFFVNADADANVSAATAAVAGDYTQRYVDQAYITSEGAFTSRTTPYTDLGTNSKIFQKLSQGYEIGMQGMSTPLYRVTIKQQDVSGQALADVIRQDRGPSTNRLYALLNGDTSPMPQGAQIYQNPNTVVTTHIWVNLASAGSSGWKSLEQAQASSGGSIESMGGYRYLKAASNSVYVDYNGTICYGEFESAGDIHDVMPAAYNRIAADFIAQREVAALTQ
ncbi:hypothetical protein [Caballeronia arvi]|nr:hypothetical protein [Caballeronia arvi]